MRLDKINLEEPSLIPLVATEQAVLIIHGQIEYGDGFAPGQITRFAFTFDGGQWATRAVNSPKEGEADWPKDEEAEDEEPNPN